VDLLKRVLVVSFFLASLIWLGKAFFLGTYPDFTVYFDGLHAYLQGANPYLEIEGSFIKYLYPPFALLFFSPMSFFSRSIGSIVWVGFSILLLLSSTALLFKIGKKKIVSSEYFVLTGLVFLMFTVKFNLGMGQFNIVNLFLITLFLFYYQKGRIQFAAISLALSLLIKVLPLLFLPYLVILRKWRLVLTLLGLVTLGLVLPFLFIKPDIIFHFFTTSLVGTIKSWSLEYYNQAFSGFIGRWLGTGEIAQLTKLLCVSLMLTITFTTLFLKRKVVGVSLLGFVSLLPLTLITLSFSWQHYFIFAIPTLIIMFFHYQKRKASLVMYSFLFVSYVLMGINFETPQDFPLFIQSHMLWGAMLAWGLTLYEIYHYD